MADYIPTQDAEFDIWVTTFAEYAGANFAALGLTSAQTTQLDTLWSTNWTSAYAGHVTAQAAAKSATASKDAARLALEAFVRQLAGQIQSNPAVTNAQRESLGITVRSGSRTPTPAITSRPTIKVDISQRLQHTIRVSDESTPLSRAKPKAAFGFELYCKKGGTPPASIADCDFLGVITNSPNVEEFTAADAGITIHYIARWVNKRGEAGPISETASATVAA
jgi:hypothetical protein